MTFYKIESHMCVFLAAIVSYFVLYGNMMPKRALPKLPKLKQDSGADRSLNHVESPADAPGLERALQSAHDIGDHRAVLAHWKSLQRFDSVHRTSLLHAMDAMQRMKKDSAFVFRELRGYLKTN